MVLQRLLALLAGVAALFTPATAIGPRPRLLAAALFPDVRDLAGPTIGHSAHWAVNTNASGSPGPARWVASSSTTKRGSSTVEIAAEELRGAGGRRPRPRPRPHASPTGSQLDQ
jgi:hypothetical protein